MTTSDKSHFREQSLSKWLSYLETIHSSEIDLGLSRIKQVAQQLGFAFTQQDARFNFAKVIIVAGTNGKGTTCAFLENALLNEKHSVAVYSSPHIEKFNERLRINKVDIDDQSLVDAFEKIELARAEISLTYYEYTTLAAFIILQQVKPDFIILEVGLGGRLDATNMIKADVAVITTIDLDHQSFLGDNREAIGFEKAGIMRANQLVVIGDTQAPQSVLAHGKKINANMLVRQQDYFVTETENIETNAANVCTVNKWQWQQGDLQLTTLNQPHIPKDNVATAIAVLVQLGVALTTDKTNSIIAQTRVAGRMELFQNSSDENSCDVMLDVAHNPQAARYLAGKLKQYQKQTRYNKVYAVIGMLEDKDIVGTLSEIVAQLDHCFIGQLPVSRAATKEQMTIAMAKFTGSFNCFDNVTQAFKIAKQTANADDLVLVFGSFHTVAEIRRLISL